MVNIESLDIDWDAVPFQKEKVVEWIQDHADIIKDVNEVWFDLDVDIISAVGNPSHRSESLKFKSGNMQSVNLDKVLRKKDSSADEEQIIFAPVMVPNEPDKDGDLVPDFVVEKAANDFLANNSVEDVDINHDQMTGQGSIRQTWTLWDDEEYEDMDGNTQEYPASTWMAGIKIEDEQDWEDVKNGDISGFSIQGAALVTETKNVQLTQNFNTEDDENNSMSESNETEETEAETEEVQEEETETEAETEEVEEQEETEEVQEEVDIDEVVDNVNELAETVNNLIEVIEAGMDEEEEEMDEEEDGEDSEDEEEVEESEDETETEEVQEEETETEAETEEVEESEDETENDERFKSMFSGEPNRQVSQKSAETDTEEVDKPFGDMWG